MAAIRIYADTSVFGGLFDPEFEEFSRMFFDQVNDGRFTLVISPVVERELAPALANVLAAYEELSAMSDMAPIPDAALELQSAYLAAGILSDRSASDALHVAVATVARCDRLVSWNFKHFVHADKAPRYAAVNVLRGYPAISIYSPREVVQYEEDV